MPAQYLLEASDDLMLGAIERKRGQRGSTSRSEANELSSCPTEVIIPCLLTRIKNGSCSFGARIWGLCSGSLSERAMDAGECEVAQFRGTTFYDGEHVVNMECRGLSKVRETAILAAILCSLRHLPPKAYRQGHEASA